MRSSQELGGVENRARRRAGGQDGSWSRPGRGGGRKNERGRPGGYFADGAGAGAGAAGLASAAIAAWILGIARMMRGIMSSLMRD